MSAGVRAFTRRCVETTRRSEWRASRAFRPRRSWRPRDCCGSVARGLLPLDRARAAHQRAQNGRAISLLYCAHRELRCAGGNVRPPGRPSTTGRALRCCPAGQLEKALGRAERRSDRAERLGPRRRRLPRHRGRHALPCAAGRLRVGNSAGAQAGAAAARAALARLDFLDVADLFLTPTLPLADVVLPVSSAWSARGCARVRADARARCYPAAPRGGRATRGGALGIPGSPASWRAASVSARNSSEGDVDAGHRFMLAPSWRHGGCAPREPTGVRLPAEVVTGAHAARRDDGVAGFATPSRRVEIYFHAVPRAWLCAASRVTSSRGQPVSRADLATRYPLVLTSAKACSSATASIAISPAATP